MGGSRDPMVYGLSSASDDSALQIASFQIRGFSGLLEGECIDSVF